MIECWYAYSILLLLSPMMNTLSFQMGQLYVDQKLYPTAEKYCEQGLRIFQINVEVNQLDIATCMHKLGVIKEALLDDETKALLNVTFKASTFLRAAVASRITSQWHAAYTMLGPFI